MIFHVRTRTPAGSLAGACSQLGSPQRLPSFQGCFTRRFMSPLTLVAGAPRLPSNRWPASYFTRVTDVKTLFRRRQGIKSIGHLTMIFPVM